MRPRGLERRPLGGRASILAAAWNVRALPNW
jgi:hypothetical protein